MIDGQTNATSKLKIERTDENDDGEWRDGCCIPSLSVTKIPHYTNISNMVTLRQRRGGGSGEARQIGPGDDSSSRLLEENEGEATSSVTSAARPTIPTADSTAEQPKQQTMHQVMKDESRISKMVTRILSGAGMIGVFCACVYSGHLYVCMIVALSDIAIRLCSERNIDTVVLTGGVFQNRLLLEGVSEKVRQSGLQLLSPQRVPANDGGISLGQAVVAAARSNR